MDDKKGQNTEIPTSESLRYIMDNQILVASNYTDGQKKLYNRIVSGWKCGSQKRAARAYHDQHLDRFLFIRHVG